MQSTITETLAALHQVQHEPDTQRAVLERFRMSVIAETLASLRTSRDAAAEWGVSDRRARAHIAYLYKRYGIGMSISGTWYLLQEDLEAFAPNLWACPAKTRDTHIAAQAYPTAGKETA